MDTTTLLVIFLGVTAVLAVGGFLIWRRQGQSKDEGYYHFRCPSCRRRLRFQARQVGHKGECSNCGGAVLFPPLSQAID